MLCKRTHLARAAVLLLGVVGGMPTLYLSPSHAEDAANDWKAPGGQGLVPGPQRLPEGALFATAEVTPDTQIQVNQPGYALVATAEVIELQPVQPGDMLNASDTSSIQFNDGTGVVINTKPVVGALVATAGLLSLVDRKHSSGLPVSDRRTTLFVGSDQPFDVAALGTKEGDIPLDSPHAVFTNPDGKTVGVLGTCRDLDPQKLTDVSVRTLDAAGDTLREGQVRGKSVDGTPWVKFDRPIYRGGQRGVLQIGNLNNYRKVKEWAGFGLAGNVVKQDITIQAENARGLPSKVPFPEKKDVVELRFQAERPGQIKATVSLPGLVPPRPPSEENTSPPADHLKQSHRTFDNWRRLALTAAALSKIAGVEVAPLLASIDPEEDMAEHCYEWTCPECDKVWTCYGNFCPRCWAQKNGKKVRGKRGRKIAE